MESCRDHLCMHGGEAKENREKGEIIVNGAA